MRFPIILLAIVLFSASAPVGDGSIRPAHAPAPGSGEDPGEVKALLLMCNGYGANYFLIRDVMELYGWDVTTAAVTPTVTKCYYGSALTVDTLVTEIADVSQFDILAIMTSRLLQPGGSHAQLLASPEGLDLVGRAAADSILVVALCGGTRVLAAAGVIEGVLVTGKEDYLQEYLDAGAVWAGDTGIPVLDGNFLTSTRNQINSRRICEIMRTYVAQKRAAN
jgi:putative intracellular protease/amidase